MHYDLLPIIDIPSPGQVNERRYNSYDKDKGTDKDQGTKLTTPPPPPTPLTQRGDPMSNFGLASLHTLPKRGGAIEEIVAPPPPPQDATTIYLRMPVQEDPHPIENPVK